MSVKSVILIDFDNLFSALWKVDKAVALRFADAPSEWLSRLSDKHLTTGTRRWLVARAYLNPDGIVPAPEELSGRIALRKFRASLMRAGFEVIDCPSLTKGGKSAADMRMVIDAIDLLASPNGYEEFVIGSGDADFAPLLLRLRGHDRRTTIVAPRPAAAAYTALADQVIGFDVFAELIQPDTAIDPKPHVVATENAERFDATGLQNYLRKKLESSTDPLSLSKLAHEAGQKFPGVRAGKYFGAGTFTKAVRRLDLPTLRVSQHFVWDDRRHDAPQDAISPAGSGGPNLVVIAS